MNPQLTSLQAAWCLKAHSPPQYSITGGCCGGPTPVTGSAFTHIPVTAQDPRDALWRGHNAGHWERELLHTRLHRRLCSAGRGWARGGWKAATPSPALR